MRNIIINLTQHVPTDDQLAAGAVNLPDEKWKEVKDLLTFTSIPRGGDQLGRAMAIAQIVSDYCQTLGDEEVEFSAMIGGAPFFMPVLERTLGLSGIKPLYAFSQRVVVEVPQEDGSVKKDAIFKHVGWVEATPHTGIGKEVMGEVEDFIIACRKQEDEDPGWGCTFAIDALYALRAGVRETIARARNVLNGKG